jgi:hypothetical protein
MATQSGSSHRNSIAWQKGMELAKAVHRATQTFPGDERFGLPISCDARQYLFLAILPRVEAG